MRIADIVGRSRADGERDRGRSLTWLVGADLLWFHASAFLVVGMGAFLVALIRAPSDPAVPGWILLWAGVVALHATIVVASGTVGRAVQGEVTAGRPSAGAQRRRRMTSGAENDREPQLTGPRDGGPEGVAATIRRFPTALVDQSAPPSTTQEEMAGTTLDEAHWLASEGEPTWRRWFRRASKRPTSTAKPVSAAEHPTARGHDSTWPQAERASGRGGVGPGMGKPGAAKPRPVASWPGIRPKPPMEPSAPTSPGADERSADLPTLASAFAASADAGTSAENPETNHPPSPDRDQRGPDSRNRRRIDPATAATARSLLATFGFSERLAPDRPDSEASPHVSDAPDPAQAAAPPVPSEGSRPAEERGDRGESEESRP